MMTCKDVSTLISTGQLEEASLGRRLAVRFHLAMCRHCRAFKRQLDLLARAARASVASSEPAADFEDRLTGRLSGTRTDH